MMNDSPELDFLKAETARTFAGRLKTSTDFESLSADIEKRTGALISVSTLKRLWGYIKPQGLPRLSTLDLLSQYSGRDNFAALCKELADGSSFLSTETVRASDLKPGTEIILRWSPDRIVRVNYLGDNRFRVLDEGTSKLRAGDVFRVEAFLKGHPLYLDGIDRGDDRLPPYAAGLSNGITSIEIRTI